ncbi:MAG: FAD-dependent oxidoreductase, partial [Novosphingobium sp.]
MVEIPAILSPADVSAWEREVDVVVVGQGVAGTCAALEAHRAGAEVLIIERASGGGGASAMSSGIFYLGGGTPVQKVAGYEDTADNMANFLMASCDPLDP